MSAVLAEPGEAVSRAGRISQTDLAELLGVTRQSVHELVQRGILATDQDGLLPLAATRDAILANVRPGAKSAQLFEAANPPAPAPVQPPAPHDSSAGEQRESLTSIRIRRESAEAERAEIELRKATGELVNVADVRAAMAGKVAALREAAMQIPSRLAPVLAPETDQARVYEHLENEMRGMLAFVSDEATGVLPVIH